MNGNGKPKSAADLAGPLAGRLKGPADLSTSDEYMEDFGADSLPASVTDSSTCE